MYKFSDLHKDQSIQKIQLEIQDNMATQTDLSGKADKTISIVTVLPKLTDLSDGDKKVYYDGTNYWKYERIGSQLFKTQITRV